METFAAVLTAFLFWAFVAHVTIGNRRTARETAGEMLVTVSRMSYGDWFFQIFLCIMLAAMLIYFAFLYITGLRSGYLLTSGMVFLSVFIAFKSCWIVVMRSVVSRTEFRRHGIITPHSVGPLSFVPWSHILYCKRLAKGRKLLVQAENYRFEIKIDPQKTEQINAVLTEHVETHDSKGKTINADRLPFEFPDEPRAVKRRRLQFNIKTALLFMVVASSAFAWWGIHLRAGWREQEALSRLEEFGVKVDYRNGRVISLDFSQGSDSLSDEDLRHLDAFQQLSRLDLSKMPITDAGLEHIKNLSGLTSLDLNDTQVTDAGLAHIQNMTALQYLHLSNTRIADEGMKHLESLTRLKWLGLDGTKITDAGLAHIEGLSGLKHLYLGRTQVTDAGMIHLKPLTQLEWIDLNGTKVTDAGLVHLEDFDDLQDLVSFNSKITLEGTQRLKEKQPNLTAY